MMTRFSNQLQLKKTTLMMNPFKTSMTKRISRSRKQFTKHISHHLHLKKMMTRHAHSMSSIRWITRIQKGENPSNNKPDDEIRESFNRACEERFADFNIEKITSPYHGAFTAGRRFRNPKLHKRNLPPAPETIKDLEHHPLREQFKEAQRAHLASHKHMKSYEEMDRRYAKGQQILSSMWVFVYKTDKHGYLQKCKARLVVCGNQQAKGDLPTRATTLASTAFRSPDIDGNHGEIRPGDNPMDAINAFVHCDLDEVVYMNMPPGFTKQGKVLRLRKALYGLRRSPLLWQMNLTNSLKELGFKAVPQEPCVMLNGSIVVFFYVDDIVFCYR